MAQEVVGAILRLVEPEKNKGFDVSFNLPSTNKLTKFSWNKGNNFETEVPTKITYKDDHKKTVVFHENYAKFLLDVYGVKSKSAVKKGLGVLEFVKEVKREQFQENAFGVTEPEPAQEESEKKTKGKKDEK
jgi:hypothetical protein